MKQLRHFFYFMFTVLLVLITGCQSNYSVSRSVKFSSLRSDQIKVMTFNIRTRTIIDVLNNWSHRKGFVVDTIAGNAADIVGLQEVKNSQLKYVKSALPQYGVYAVGRSNGRSGGESCPVLYRKDRFELIDSGTFWFSDTPSVPGSKGWGNLPPRICSWAHLVETDTGSGFYVYNLHLDNLSQNSREKSVKLLMEKISVRQTNEPFVILGDFNMEPRNPAMQWLNRIGITKPRVASIDAWQSIHPNSLIGTRHGFTGHLSGPHIDHILLSSNLRPMDARIDNHSWNGRYPSDHFPVVANIQLDRTDSNRSVAASTQVTPKNNKDTSVEPGML